MGGGSVSKESTSNIGDLTSIPGLGRSPGEGHGYPFQYSMDRGAWQATVHGVTELDITEQLTLGLDEVRVGSHVQCLYKKKRPQQACSWPLEDTGRRQPSSRSEESPQQTLNMPTPGTGTSRLQNLEKKCLLLTAPHHHMWQLLWQLNVHGSAPMKVYSWTLRFEFYIMFMSHEIFSSCFSSNHLKHVRTILSSETGERKWTPWVEVTRMQISTPHKNKRTFFIICVVLRGLICLEFPTGGGMCGSATWGVCRGTCVSPEPWTDSVLLTLGSKQDL